MSDKSSVTMRMSTSGATVRIESNSNDLGPILNKAFRCSLDALTESLRDQGGE